LPDNREKVGMPWLNTLRTMYLAFYSKHAYIRAAREWKGIGYGYLFVLVLISSLCIGLWVHTWLNIAIAGIEKHILPQLPSMTFADGHLTIDKELPYVISVNGNGLCRFDKTNDLPPDPVEFAPIVLGTSDAAVYARGKGILKEWVYEKVWSLVLDPLGVTKFVKFIKTWGGLVVAGVLLPIHFLWVASQTLFLGAIGRVFTNTMHVALTYSRLVRISVVAVTPGVVLGTLLIVSNQFFALWLGIYAIMGVIYLFYGVYSNKHADDHLFFQDMPIDDGYPETTEFES